uniref:Urotensin-2 n=1 Tax=Sus scrofa TaxID=9823 RepID=A0A8D2CFA2_PIG
MSKLVPCLLFLGCLGPLFALPVPDSRKEPLPFSAPEDVRSAWDELERASLLQMLPETPGAEAGEDLREADAGMDIFYPRGGMRKAFSGQDPNIFLSHLLARIKKPYKKRGPPSECFWKYCV